jgi:hypothetical protein
MWYCTDEIQRYNVSSPIIQQKAYKLLAVPVHGILSSRHAPAPCTGRSRIYASLAARHTSRHCMPQARAGASFCGRDVVCFPFPAWVRFAFPFLNLADTRRNESIAACVTCRGGLAPSEVPANRKAA